MQTPVSILVGIFLFTSLIKSTQSTNCFDGKLEGICMSENSTNCGGYFLDTCGGQVMAIKSIYAALTSGATMLSRISMWSCQRSWDLCGLPFWWVQAKHYRAEQLSGCTLYWPLLIGLILISSLLLHHDGLLRVTVNSNYFRRLDGLGNLNWIDYQIWIIDDVKSQYKLVSQVVLSQYDRVHWSLYVLVNIPLYFSPCDGPFRLRESLLSFTAMNVTPTKY